MNKELKGYTMGTSEWNSYIESCWNPGTKGSKRPINELFNFGQFTGQRCFVVAGGPSLRGFDWSLLKKEFTIGINKICQVFTPSLLFSWDKVCYDWYQTQFINSPIVMVDPSNANYDKVFFVRSAGEFGNPTQINKIFIGTHTGYAAINLALALDFNPIYLLGFDYIPDSSNNYHVTDDWNHPPDIDQRLKRFRLEIDGYSEYAKNEIVNLNPNSNLQTLPVADIKEII